MTAEIAMLNKQAVALAADSAVSTSDKIFRSANKIFSLSKTAPVAIMVYSRADFCGIPWETIIKEYRRNNGQQKFDTLHDYVINFLNFIQNNPIIKSNTYAENSLIYLIAFDFIDRIENNLSNIVQAESRRLGKVPPTLISDIINLVFRENFTLTSNLPELSLKEYFTYERFIEKFSDDIVSIYEKKVKKFEVFIDNLFEKFSYAIYNLATSSIFPIGYSGVVFAGFGENEIYPSVETYHLGNFLDGNLQLIKINDKCCNISNDNSATVIPFAQDDIITMFVEGIHPQIKNNIVGTFNAVIEEQIDSLFNILNISKRKRTEASETIKEFTKRIQEKLGTNIDSFININFIYPTINIISILPPDELANLAESLINLTTIKRQISLDRETVGGPTDVALISKGDGLIWIKRKHYFDPQLNHHFFKNYFNTGGNHERINEEEKD